MKNLLQEFKKFALSGDLVAVAVAFILGLAFKALVDSLVNNVIMPIVGIIVGKPSFDDLTLGIGDCVIRYRLFINAIINFLIIAATLFVIVQAYERLKAMRSPAEKAEDPSEVELLGEIRDLLRSQQRGA